jgi:hypothetical protein
MTVYGIIVRANRQVDKATFFYSGGSCFQFGLPVHNAGLVEPWHVAAVAQKSTGTVERLVR